MLAMHRSNLRLAYCLTLRPITHQATENTKSPQPQPTTQNVVYELPEGATVIATYQALLDKLEHFQRYRKYPGAGIHRDIQPPKRLVRAALELSKKYRIKNVAEEPKRLRQYLWSRAIPPEKDDVIKRGKELEIKLTSLRLHEQTSEEELTEEQLERQMVSIRKEALKAMKKTTYHWKPVEMDAYLSVVYMSSNLLANYSVLYSIMKEISGRDPDFKPASMLDFGSGLASSVWVVNEIWSSVKEHYCWDKSADICTLARLLLQEGKDHADMIYPGIYFRQTLDTHHAKQSNGFDLVVCSHTLFELPSKQSRLEHLDQLWAHTRNYLVIADNGTSHGQRLIEEARMHILTKFQNDESHRGHVFSPCSHGQPCPLLARSQSRPCNFETMYKVVNEQAKQIFLEKGPSGTPRNHALKGTSVKYSFVVLKKGTLSEDEMRAPRVLAHPKSSQKYSQCQMCCPDGNVREIKTTSQANRGIYKLIARSTWGTRLPIELPYSGQGYKEAIKDSTKGKVEASQEDTSAVDCAEDSS